MQTAYNDLQNGHAAWTPDSWREHTALQQPCYDDEQAFLQTLAKLKQAPALVDSERTKQLKTLLAQAQQGKLFVLQGGDCAETFDCCDRISLTRQVSLLQQMSQVLMHGLKLPVIQIGRLAGQYAKPRSSDVEIRDGCSLPAYRGDIINHIVFNAQKRKADPERLWQAYAHSATTLDHLRAIHETGMESLLESQHWQLEWLDHADNSESLRTLLATVHERLGFIHTLTGANNDDFLHRELFLSHEALLLEYEQALTRQHVTGEWFNQSTHLPWVGVRTSLPEGAHVEYLRGLANPVAVKIGPETTADRLLYLIERLNPTNEAGRLTLIHRMGITQLTKCLGPLIDAVQRSGALVLWLCDPMHGNTRTLPCGTKTRLFDEILAEIAISFRIHSQYSSSLGGLHLEMTGEAVTECLGGAKNLQPADLSLRYYSKVDPRLNAEQAMELALQINLNHASWQHGSQQP